MRILITGATGLVGRNLLQILVRNHQLTLIGRSKDKLVKLFQDQGECLTWDDITLDIVKKHDVVINLAGENIGAKRWSEKHKNTIIHSRIKTTSLLSYLCAQLGKNGPRLINASAIGIYGSAFDSMNCQAATENDFPTSAQKNYLHQVAFAWEKKLQPAIDAGVNVIIMRFAIILDRHDGALSKILPSFQVGAGAILGSGVQPFAWVLIEDVIKALCFMMINKIPSGAYNIVSDEVTTQKKFAKILAKILHRPVLFRVPSPIIKILLGQMGKELLLEGANVSNQKIKDLGFSFDYPTLNKALGHLFLQ